MTEPVLAPGPLTPDPVYEKLKQIYLIDRKNVILTSMGGYGKSYYIKKLVQDYKKPGEQEIYATASTGVAAVNIGGSTVHRFFGMGLAKGNVEQVINYVRKNINAVKRIIACKYLIIDEISMISNVLFNKMDAICKYYRKNNAPFGGIYLLVSGDFLQLPPVDEDWGFKSKSWKECNFIPYFLTEPKRFTDKAFCAMLSRAREGKLLTNDIVKLKSRVKAHEEYLKTVPGEGAVIKPTILYSHKVDVELINKNELKKLEGDIFEYKCTDEYVSTKKIKIENYKPLLDNILPDTVYLKKNAQVMLVYNLDVDSGLCNGSRGVVTDISPQHVTVLFKNGLEIIIDPIGVNFEDDNVVIGRKQYPLVLAYASTIHKAQGSTLDYCIIDLGPSVFAPGQAYVALSRARSWDSVLVSSFVPTAFKVDKEALAYFEELEEMFNSI